jgi:hypothetical protein
MTRSRSNAVSGTSAPFVGSQRSSGSSYAPMIKVHRQQQQDPVLDMQQAIGNQATQQAISEPRPPSAYADLSEELEESRPLSAYADLSEELDEDEDSEYDDEYDDEYEYDGYESDEGAQNSVAKAPNSNGFHMKSMITGMDGFDRNRLLPANTKMSTVLPSKTYYADTDEKKTPFARGFDEKGKMTNASDGSALNTIGATKAAFKGSNPDRHIFTMDGNGEFSTADAIKENQDRGKAAQDSGATEQERFHHSSFHAGNDVAGAGEMQVRDGQVELVSDTSGHYQPGSRQMMQTVQQLGKKNVEIEKLGLEFVGKGDTNNMKASATELLGYENHSPETAETQMRAMHDKKNNVLNELLKKAQGNPEGANLMPSELNTRPEEATSDTVAQAPPAASRYYFDEEDQETNYKNVDETDEHENEEHGFQYANNEDKYYN